MVGENVHFLFLNLLTHLQIYRDGQMVALQKLGFISPQTYLAQPMVKNTANCNPAHMGSDATPIKST